MCGAVQDQIQTIPQPSQVLVWSGWFHQLPALNLNSCFTILLSKMEEKYHVMYSLSLNVYGAITKKSRALGWK